MMKKFLFNIRFPWAALIIVITWVATVLAIVLAPEINVVVVLLTTFTLTVLFALIGFKSPV